MSLINFVHANGFPGGSYRTLFQIWSEHYEVMAHPMLGHHPGYPVEPHWRMQVRELVDWLKHRTQEPVWGVGHSFGAVVTFMAAYQFPEMFKGIILLDPPLLNGWNAWVFALACRLGMGDRMTPAGRSKNRRQHWKSYEEVLQYFQSRPFYQQMDVRCLNDYISAGVQQQEDGSWGLTYRSEIEVALFRTTPYDYWRYWRLLKVPGVLIRGDHSTVTTVQAANRLAHAHGLVQLEMAGAHLFPLVNPDSTALRVHQTIELLRKMSRLG